MFRDRSETPVPYGPPGPTPVRPGRSSHGPEARPRR